MKVALVNTYDISGGAAIACYRLHRGLIQRGVDSTLVVKQKKSDDATVSALGADHIPIDEHAISLVHDRYVRDNRSKLSDAMFSLPYPGYDLSSAVEIRNADLINLHWVATYQSPETIRKLACLGKPILWTLHDQWAFTGGCHYSGGCRKYETDCAACPQLRKDPFNLPAAALAGKLASFQGIEITIVSPSGWLASEARKSRLFKDCRIEIIPYGLDTESFKPVPKSEAREKLGIDPNRIIILFGSENLSEKRKGRDQLLDCLEYCRDNVELMNLVRADNVGFMSFGLQDEAFDRLDLPVHALGYLDSAELMSLAYSASDMYLLPTLEDNLPNTMLEAMGCGTPVIAFNTGGVPDAVVEGITGRIVENSYQMGDAVLSLVLDQDQRVAMASNCRKAILASFTLEIQARRHLELFEALLENRRKAIFQPPQQTNAVHRLLPIDTNLDPNFQASCLCILFQCVQDLSREKDVIAADSEERLRIIRDLVEKTPGATTTLIHCLRSYFRSIVDRFRNAMS